MKDRIYHLRKEVKGLSREDFANAIGMSASELRNVENGVTTLKENKVPILCSVYNVREEWLRTGEGPMHPPQNQDDEIADIVKAASQQDPEKAVKFFQDLLRGMSDAEIVLLYEIFKKHCKD